MTSKQRLKDGENFTKACIMAWIGSVVTVILAIIPKIQQYFGGPVATYDPNVAILTATLIAIIWYVYWTYRVVLVPSIETKRQQEQIRKNLATALLTELQWLDGRLRDIYDGGEWPYDPFSYPMLLECEKSLYLFTHRTVSNIANFHGRLEDLQRSFLSKNMSGLDEKNFNNFMRLKTFLIITLLNDLASNLRSEGASEPELRISVECFNWESPKLPDCSFADPKVYKFGAKSNKSELKK